MSASAESCSAVSRQENEEISKNAYRELVASCTSLSKYESTSLRTAIPQIVVCLIAASFHIVLGISLGFSAIFIPQVESEDSDLKLDKWQTSWIASIIVISAPIGNLMSGVIMDSIGRLNTLKLVAIPCALGWIVIAVAQNFYVVLLGRIIVGITTAIGAAPVPVYITEVSRPDLRGSLNSLGPTVVTTGLIIAYLQGAFLSWRIVSGLSLIFIVIAVIGVQFFVPESAIWLVSKGRNEEARQSLQYMYRYYPQPEESAQSLAEMHLKILEREQNARKLERMKMKEKQKLTGNKSIFGNSRYAGFLKPTGYKPLFMLFWLFLIQQYSGNYMTLFYSVTFIQEIGTNMDPFAVSIFLGVVRLIMSINLTWILRRFKRRHLVMVSSIGMAICMSISGLFTLWIKQGVTKQYWIPIMCWILYVCTSMIGLLSIPWLITAELYPSELRGIGNSVTFSMANVLMFAGIQSYRPLSDILGGAYAVQWMFAAFSVLGFFYALLVLPETHGKKLSEIEEFYMGKKEKQQKLDERENRNMKSGKELEHMLKNKEIV